MPTDYERIEGIIRRGGRITYQEIKEHIDQEEDSYEEVCKVLRDLGIIGDRDMDILLDLEFFPW